MKRLLMKGLEVCLCVMLIVLSIPIQIAGAETSLEGWFDEDTITVYLGDITPVSGYVTCNGSDLVQITYQIEGWSGEDDNNRYCTQAISGKSVDLWDMDQLLLDTTTEPLNVPGNYVLWLVARAEDGYWDKLDSAIVCVEENEDEYDNEWDDDWEDEYDNEWEYDEVETDYEENHSSDRVKSQDTTNVATELWGMFYDDSVDLTIGDAVRVNGYVSSEGSEIVQVTYQIDGWYGIDENNRYCTQETNSYDLNLADMNSLVLNTNTEPLNMPGTYTLRLAAKTADGTWKKLDSMTVYVRDVFSSNASASEEHAASREPDANSNNSDNVSSLPSAISSSSAVKTVEAANIRAEANKDSESLGTVPTDTVLDYYGYSQKDNRGVAWYLVNYNGMQAWISSSVADVIEKNMQYSHAEDNPAPNASDLENAANSNASFETKPNENTSSLPSEISPDSAVQAFASANVRAEANKDSESLGTVLADTVLDYYGYSQKDDRGVVWYLVNYQGKRAWISSSVADVIAKSTGTDDVKANTDNQSSNTNSEVIIEGEFGSKSYGMMTGSKLDVYFGATVQNANLHSATINIDGYQNTQYVNKQFSDVGHACSDYLTLDGSVAPLNTPGTYTIKLFIKSDACDANGNLIYKEVDRATLVVQENATNKTEQTTTDSNETGATANSGNAELSAKFTYDTMTIVLGNTWMVDATISAKNTTIGTVTVNVRDYDKKLSDDFKGHVADEYPINLKHYANYKIDTNEAPFNKVGTYTLFIWAKDVNDVGGDSYLDEMTIKVIEKPEDNYEYSKYYQNLQNIELTGNQGRDIVTVAMSQVGYHEGSLMGDSKLEDNYTEYNRSLREDYGISWSADRQEWCAAFVSWCARQAGISTSILPNSLGASPDSGFFKLCGAEAMKGAETYTWKQYMDGEYQPQEGDILFVGYYSTGNVAAVGNEELHCTHVAIITKVTKDDSKVIVETVEGNQSNKVAMKSRTVGSKNLKTGYYGSDNKGNEYYIMYIAHPGYLNTKQIVSQTAVKQSTLESAVTVVNKYKAFAQNGRANEHLKRLNALNAYSVYSVTSNDVISDYSKGKGDVWLGSIYNGLTSDGAVSEVVGLTEDEELALMVDILMEMVSTGVAQEDLTVFESMFTTSGIGHTAFDTVNDMQGSIDTYNEIIKWIGQEDALTLMPELQAKDYGLTAVSIALDWYDIYKASDAQKKALVSSVLEYDANMKALDRIINASTGTLQMAAKQVKEELENAYIGQFNSVYKDAYAQAGVTLLDVGVGLFDYVAAMRGLYGTMTNQTSKMLDAEDAFIEYVSIVSKIQVACNLAVANQDPATYDLLQLYCIGLQYAYDNTYEYYESYGNKWFTKYDTGETLALITQQKAEIVQLQKEMQNEIM